VAATIDFSVPFFSLVLALVFFLFLSLSLSLVLHNYYVSKREIFKKPGLKLKTILAIGSTSAGMHTRIHTRILNDDREKNIYIHNFIYIYTYIYIYIYIYCIYIQWCLTKNELFGRNFSANADTAERNYCPMYQKDNAG